MLQDNGPRDASGNCLGTIYIFSGRMMTCNKSGVKSGWKNCCQAGTSALGEDVGSAESLYSGANAIETVYHLAQIAYYGTEVLQGTAVNVTGLSTNVQNAIWAVAQGGSLMDGFTAFAEAMMLNPTTWILAGVMYAAQEILLSGSCTQEDLETAMMDQAGRCHSLGTYCSDKWPLVGCVQTTEAFCCFNSMLARLIQEQGRPQLQSFNPNPWGVETDAGPADADCRGFTSTEFQMLDFSKMDLSSYFGQIATQVQSTIQQNVSDKISGYYNSIQQQPQ
jgi:conjugal transfer mating pair stabilization protein TraN